MKNILFLPFFIGVASLFSLNSTPLLHKSTTNPIAISTPKKEVLSESQLLYSDLNLVGKLPYNIFETALNGYNRLKHNLKNTSVITIIDFSLPSTEKRMYVIDILHKKVLFNTIVSHGKNSGDLYATDFSNRNGSHQSSLGFYITENTYQGSNGLSLVINGVEKGINDLAKPRAVVIHGANYCSEDIIKKTGRLGRSYGCPALPRELNGPIVHTIKNGTLLFIYANDKEYLASSKYTMSKDESMLALKDESEDSALGNNMMK